MRVVWVVAAVLAASAPAWADDEPTLDAALAQAARENKPLVLEFHAEWCKPCKFFEQNVLSRADVQAALKHVVFVRYDLDSDLGSAVGRELGVSSVPTLLVLDGLGKEIARQEGVPLSSNAYLGFMDWLEQNGGARAGTAELEGAVAAAPDNLEKRRKLASHYRAIGRMQDAIDQLVYIAEHASTRRDLAAEAAAERDAIVIAEARLADMMAAAETFIENYPESRLASQRLAFLALSQRVSRDRLDAIAQKHLDAVLLAEWPDAVRAAQIAGAESLAHRSIMDRLAQTPAEPIVHLMRAEELVQRRDRAAAYAELDQACGHESVALWCYTLHQTLDLRRSVPSRLEQLRDAAQQQLDALSTIEPKQRTDRIDRLDDIDEHLGTAVAVALDQARLDCGYLAWPNTAAMVLFELTRAGGRPRIKVYAGDDELTRCVSSKLDHAWLPSVRPTRDERVVAAIAFTKPRASERPYRMPPRFGVMPELVVRQGDLETMGARGEFLVGPRTRIHGWLVGGTVEFAGGDTLEPAYLARALGGYDIRLPRFGSLQVSFLTGVGVSDLGTMAPRALEVPVQERLRFSVGRVRVHAWAETTSVFFGGMRNSSDVVDEVTIGTGMSFPISERRFFLGAAYERRTLATGAMFTFGIPFGELY